MDGKATRCPQITEGKVTLDEFNEGDTKRLSILLDGKEIYEYLGLVGVGRDYYDMIGYRGEVPPRFKGDPRDEYSGGFENYVPRKNERGYDDKSGVMVRTLCSRGDFEVDIEFNASNTIEIPLSDGYLLEYKIINNKLTLQKDVALIDYSDVKVPVLTSTEKRNIAIVRGEPENSLLKDYLNCFIATLSGNYIIPHAYVVDTKHSLESQPQAGTKHSLESQPQAGTGKGESFTIVNKPIYGSVRLDTIDGRFYLQYTRNNDGVLVGEMIRTRLIPFHETAKEGEVEGCLRERSSEGYILTPVYFSYYDPDGTGKQITREDYERYLRDKANIIRDSTAFPKELGGLLGF